MSLFDVNNMHNLEVIVYFKNIYLGGGTQTECLYADDNKYDRDSGRTFKYSQFDTEKNLFTFPGNVFLSKLTVAPDLAYGRGLFMWQYCPKIPKARPKLDGSHKTILERE
jgi:hypothetical protein